MSTSGCGWRVRTTRRPPTTASTTTSTHLHCAPGLHNQAEGCCSDVWWCGARMHTHMPEPCLCPQYTVVVCGIALFPPPC